MTSNPELQDGDEIIYIEEDHSNKITFKEKCIIIKNVIVISLGFMLLFTSFLSLQNLQSSLNADKGIGLISLSIMYAMIICSTIYAPFVVGHLGPKYTVCVSVLTECGYVAANFVVDWHYVTLPLSAIFTGLVSGPQWAAQGTYINSLGKEYAYRTNENQETMTSRLFGIFVLFFSSANIWGNMISSFVLQTKHNSSTITDDFQACGSNFCLLPDEFNYTSHSNLIRPSENKIYLMCGIYVCLDLLAGIIMLLFLDNLTKDKSKSKPKLTLDILMKTFKQMQDEKQIFLIPLTCYTGFQYAFIAGEFSLAFISCMWGIDNIGLVLMSYGIVNCTFSIICGALIKFTGRIFLFLTAFLIHITLLLVMLFWKPLQETTYIFFIIGPFWGAADAIWQVQLLSLYGTLFTDEQEAAFSNKALWESVGFVIFFASASYLCTVVKIYILLTFIILAFILYCVLEYRVKKVMKYDI